MQIKYTSNTVALHVYNSFLVRTLVICYIKSVNIVDENSYRSTICLYGCKVKLDTALQQL